MKTALYDRHIKEGAKIVDFAGWEMPIQYTGILEEHQTVRNHVGMFDVSHMGRITVQGEDSENFLDYLSTNKIAGKKEGTATYTVLPDQAGHCLDDVIVYKQSQNQFFIIANASNRERDKNHLLEQSKNYQVKIQDHFDGEGILAIQGPKAIAVISRLYPNAAQLKPMTFYQDGDVIVSRTGYTGADGVEIYASNEMIISIWDWCLENGVKPIGLGARDTLRLEMGYALYGHELSTEIFPNETLSAWTIKWGKPNFIGKEAMLSLESSPEKRGEYGVVLKERGVPREGFNVYYHDQLIGKTTSGTYSPSLQKGIAIILSSTPLKEGDQVEIEIRNRKLMGQIVKLPFYTKGES